MRAFFGSMTGRVFMFLLIGVVASAALTQWLAVGERQRAIEQYRDYHAVERAEQLVMAADVVPLASRAAYLKVANKGSVRLELRPEAEHTPGVPTEFSSALQAKLGEGFKVTAVAERPAACVKPRKPATLFGPKTWGGTCENLDVRMQDGHVLRLMV
ncbi:MAG: two-component sensor histidine kinase, partial [Janthinobacterium sp.]